MGGHILLTDSSLYATVCIQDLEVKFSTMQREQSQLGAIKQQAMELKTRMQQLEKSHSARALEQEGNTKAAQMTRPGPVLSTDSASSVTADVQRIEVRMHSHAEPTVQGRTYM